MLLSNVYCSNGKCLALQAMLLSNLCYSREKVINVDCIQRRRLDIPPLRPPAASEYIKARVD